MNEFSVDSQILLDISKAGQERTYAEELELLLHQGKDISWLIEGLQTNEKSGISADLEELKRRREAYGSNERYKKEPPGFCELLWQALEDFTLRILIVASILSIVIEVATAQPDHRSIAWIQGFAIMVAVMISAFVTAINDYQK